MAKSKVFRVGDRVSLTGVDRYSGKPGTILKVNTPLPARYPILVRLDDRDLEVWCRSSELVRANPHKGSTLASALDPNPIQPNHYTARVKGVDLDCLDVITALGLDFNLGNAMKYLWRAGKKDPTKTKEDLQKAVEYLTRAVGGGQ